VKAFVWQVQPSVRIDADGFLALVLEQGNDLACEVPFAAAIDTTDPDQQAVLRGYLLLPGSLLPHAEKRPEAMGDQGQWALATGREMQHRLP